LAFFEFAGFNEKRRVLLHSLERWRPTELPTGTIRKYQKGIMKTVNAIDTEIQEKLVSRINYIVSRHSKIQKADVAIT